MRCKTISSFPPIYPEIKPEMLPSNVPIDMATTPTLMEI